MITSNQNPRIKLTRSLMEHPKERRETGAFIAEGIRLIEDALFTGWPFRFVLHTANLNGRGMDLLSHLQSKEIELNEIPAELMNAISSTETSQGILAVLGWARLPLPVSPDFILIPDQIRDPGNLGTLLRTAEAAGAQAAFIPPETTDPFAPKVVRSGMGAHFRLPIHSLTWEEIISWREMACQRSRQAGSLQEPGGLKTCLADMQGTLYWELDLRKPIILIVGGEASGASQQARMMADVTIGIPMAGGTESLNAAAAGAILLYEVVRQRRGS